MSNYNTKKALGSSLRFLTVRGRREWIILAVRIAHVPYFISILQRTCEKNYGGRTLKVEPPLPPKTSQYTFSLITPPLRAYLLFE